jgi:hypothetical protein
MYVLIGVICQSTGGTNYPLSIDRHSFAYLDIYDSDNLLHMSHSDVKLPASMHSQPLQNFLDFGHFHS